MRAQADPSSAVTRASALARDFWPPNDIAGLEAVEPDSVPEPARGLLDHQSHMTVAMERFHGTEVRLRVAAVVDRPDVPGTWYAREILLEKPDGVVVQYGIVRIDLGAVDAETARTIRAGRRPLGRVLIDAGVLRDVHRVALVAIRPGPHLAGLMRLPTGGSHGNGPRATPSSAPVPPPGPGEGGCVYGRVAEILLNGRPAVQLLEIVAPVAIVP